MSVDPHGISIHPGEAHPLGATVDDDGVNFSLYSQHATGVTLLIFNQPDDAFPSMEIILDPATNSTFHFWHVRLQGLKPGVGYAYRVDGPRNVTDGHRFNPNKVLVDAYAKGICFDRWERADACHDGDNVATSLRGIVISTSDFDWDDDRPLHTPIEESVIYEVHVGGFTKSPSSGVTHPGTFLGLIEKIPYLQSLGVTAVELLPVFDFDDTEPLRMVDGKPLVNYWGYSTLGFFSPHHGYCVNHKGGDQVREFRTMVKALHKAGIEVILDVVFNHTDEGNHQGPTISFRGTDNRTYYYLTGDGNSREFYYDYTGCGNTFNCNHPIGEKFILDCLRYWVKEMHVDGFRFDEGSVLTRGEDGKPLEHPPVIWAVELDEVLANTKVVAEAWDAAGLYQVGYFPGERWGEWNGKFRDAMRRFVKGDAGMIGEVAQRLTGSADLYQWRKHQPVNSVNFITAHDGFTMHDLVSYNNKNNWANGESNADGINDNLSWNCGVEGDSADGTILAFRERQVKNFAVLLLLSMGVPMIVGGDEHLRTQGGNNNPYCQDNTISWFDWSRAQANASMVRFWSQLIRKRQMYLHHFRGRFLGSRQNRFGVSEISWHGAVLNKPLWNDPESRCLAYTLGDVEQGADGTRNIHVMMNMHSEPVEFQIPKYNGLVWRRSVDTALPSPMDIDIIESQQLATTLYLVTAHSIVVLVSAEEGR